jgi:hypothetical protein
MPDATRRPIAGRLQRASAALLCVLLALAPTAAQAQSREDLAQFSVNAGALTFSKAPALPTLKAVALNGNAQTTSTKMTNIGIDNASGSEAGWNVTVTGEVGAGDRAIFTQYCPAAKCGATPEGYVAGGITLPADSLALNSTGARFRALVGSSGAAPTFKCAAGCFIDSATPVKIISAEVKTALGTWQTAGFTATSLALSTPSTLRVLPATEVYRVNLLWTLSTGP